MVGRVSLGYWAAVGYLFVVPKCEDACLFIPSMKHASIPCELVKTMQICELVYC
jgi:hypothetical protein